LYLQLILELKTLILNILRKTLKAKCLFPAVTRVFPCKSQ